MPDNPERDSCTDVDVGRHVAQSAPPGSSSNHGSENLKKNKTTPSDAEESLAPEVHKEEPKGINYFQLYRFASTSDVILMSFGILMAMVAGAMSPVTTILTGNLVNTFVVVPADPSPEKFAEWQDNLMASVIDNTKWFLYISVITFGTTYIYMSIFVALGEKQSHRIRQEYLRSVLRQNIGWHDHEGAGELATRITSDILLIQDAISDKVPNATAQVFTLVAALAIAFYRNAKLTGVLLVAIPCIGACIFVLSIFAGRLQSEILRLYSLAGNIAEETFSAMRTVTAFNGQQKQSVRYAARIADAHKAGVKKALVTGAGASCLFMFIYLTYSLAFYYGSVLLKDNAIDAGTVTNVIFAVLIGTFALSQIAPELQAFAYGVGAGTKIFATLDRAPPIDALSTAGKKLAKEDVHGRIVLRDVEFTYPSRPDVKILKKLNLVAEPGTTVALVGQSGSGKSTIIQLLERFYDADAGEILLDGHRLTDLNITWLRQQIGYVQQEPTLFEGSVAENVALGLAGTEHEFATPDAKLELITDACKMANAHEFIQNLPLGYDTQVGERGLLLSGGQKQRIAIARAIVRNPRILLLDEATSALDTTSERVVQAALDNAARGRTTIVIAHRLSTVRHADQIICMLKGEVVEKGTHEELVAQGGMYKALVDAQQLHQDENSAALKEDDDYEKDASRATGGADADEAGKTTQGYSDRYLTPDSKSVKSSKWSGVDPETSSKRKRTTGYILNEILKLSRPDLIYNLGGLIGATAAGMVVPVFALLFGSILQTFSEAPDQRDTDLHFWSTMFIVIAAGAALSNLFQNWMFALANELLTERVRDKLFAALLRQDIAFFDDDSHTTGALTANLSSDAQQIQGAAGVTLGNIVQLATTLFGGLGIGFAYGWKLTLVACVLIPVLVFAGALRMLILTFFHEKAKRAYERSAQVAAESVAAIRTVQSLTTEKKVHDGYIALLAKPLADGYRNAYINTLAYAFSQSASFMGNALVFWYGGRLIAYEGYNIKVPLFVFLCYAPPGGVLFTKSNSLLKSFFVIFMAIMFGSMSAGRIFTFVPDISKALSSADAVLDILERTPPIDSDSPAGETVTPSQVTGEIEFRDVRFSYPSRPSVRVLRGLTLTVKPGQFVALVGPSGCGKSTTVGLLERFYDPLAGDIFLDGTPLRSLNLRSYRAVVGLVSQEPNLFDGSIAENIAFGCAAPPSAAEIEAAARAANIHDFVASLPDGYGTRVGARGAQLSGGQKQRVAIARALVRNPKVLLLDEATSALDAESEKVVQRALDAAAVGRTTIAIAHRLSTIQHADVIYVVKDGRVVEVGSHQELYDKRGMYYDLATQQDLEVESE
ncbi:putative ABC multidrug transporter [Zopfochytrium polystomum]|nr:putative ABC multidrug transporter [Zopfochytrium polystomum]